jgi:hypothetical protein
MTHIAMVEQLDGNAVTWMEPVGDEQNRSMPSSAAIGVAEHASPKT